MSSRQTVSFLRRRFAEVGISPATRYGQNFLIDLNLIELLADAADLDHQDVVLEVGTGTGSLTALLAARAGAVVTVEIDPHLYQLAREELIQFPNVTMLQQDALRNKNNFHPHVLETLRQRLADIPGSRLKLAANLPYNVATPILSNLLLTEVVPVSLTATIQKELAERMMAEPRTKDYSALSVWVQSQCDVELIRELPPTVFWPRPRVTSAIIQLRVDQARREQIGDLTFFHSFVRALFLHRRKFLRSQLASALKPDLDKAEIDEVLAAQALSGQMRAEELTWEQILSLGEAVRQRIQAS
jgi:16S rRNA (adenine1518-N6/adenine1519-N6)-dimethyltransferase